MDRRPAGRSGLTRAYHRDMGAGKPTAGQPSGGHRQSLLRRALARRERTRFLRRLVALSLLLIALNLVASGAFAGFEGYSYWRGLMQTLDTVATIGSFKHPTDLGGQVTTVVLITFGLGTLFYLLVTVSEMFVAGELSGLLERRRMERKIEEMSDHYLICGFGRVGHLVARDLAEAGVPFVVIDDNPEMIEQLEQSGHLYLEGRGSDDHVMHEAGIERARGVIACVDSDAENIFITLTARGMCPGVEIVARASEEASEQKLLRAGADDIVSPYKASGHAMARLALAGRAEELAREHLPAFRSGGDRT
jgi:voltage-gated potassium channel